MAFSEDPIHTTEKLHQLYKTKSISIYLVVILVITALVAALPYIKIDISSQSRGMIRSKIDNVPVNAVVSGKVEKIFLKNNLTVKKGDTLLVIAKDIIATQKEVQSTFNAFDGSLASDLQAAINQNVGAIQNASVKQDFYKYQAQLKELQSKREQATINYQRNKTLYDRGVIAKAQFENFDFDYKNSIQAEISFRKSQLSQWESQKRSIQEKIQQQTGTINQLNSEEINYYIIAPSNGTIERFIGIQEGSFVSPQQPIAYISPNNNLIVENHVSPKDIGLIRMNQKVKFQLDAFNYNQWGLLEGKVIDIDNNLSTDNNQAYFKVRCVILKNELKLKTGYKTKASKGMTVTTRFMITRRSLYDLLFDKVDDWLNPKIL